MGDGAFDFTLLENGLDSIASAVEHLSAGSSKRELKYAVLHLSGGIELVLKERLHRDDWRLLFEDSGKASEAAYRSGSFRSVGLESCLDRLADTCGVKLSDKARRELIAFRYIRNRLEHFRAADSAEAVIGSATRVLEIIVDFIAKELDDGDLEPVELELLEQIRERLGELELFIEARLKSVEPVRKSAYSIVPCPFCRQDTLSIDAGVECLFCGYSNSAEGAAEDYADRVAGISSYMAMKDGGRVIGRCPDCEDDTCVDNGAGGNQNPEVKYICFTCGSTWLDHEFRDCSSCGEWMVHDEEGIGICDPCFHAQVANDD